ncbi:MAG TPA: alpha-1,2-fucosyltransferase [Steroidobacteraceae bacterium]|nr:alpha-1,2-fucosyltransferase [Steroidobacteraceae bacterium]
MIIIKLMGGLGNQLFQWALGLALEYRGNQVQYDKSLLDVDPARRYLLGDLGLDLKFTHEEKSPTIVEKSLLFDPAILELKGDHVLQGYWQSEKYFADRASYIRAKVFSRTKFSPLTLAMSMQIFQKPDSCFVHVRRTDNLRAWPASRLYHDLTDGGPYYDRALKIIREKHPTAHLFIFSDDAKWVHQNWGEYPHTTVVEHNAPSFDEDDTHYLHKHDRGREVEDLWLMSLCRHAIISNSTFAWWGAYLRRREDERIVIAPDPWYATKDAPPTEIIPERWTKVPVR